MSLAQVGTESGEGTVKIFLGNEVFNLIGGDDMMNGYKHVIVKLLCYSMFL